MRFSVLVVLLIASLAPAQASVIDTAFNRASAQFEDALPHLPPALFDVDISAYRDALLQRSFQSSYWGGRLSLAVVQASAGQEASCKRFAAFVRLPPENGQVSLILCPQFSTDGADALRTLTVLHELVHVVAGPDECRAMAFAATVEKLATGDFTNVDRYWQANGCNRSGFSLP